MWYILVLSYLMCFLLQASQEGGGGLRLPAGFPADPLSGRRNWVRHGHPPHLQGGLLHFQHQAQEKMFPCCRSVRSTLTGSWTPTRWFPAPRCPTPWWSPTTPLSPSTRWCLSCLRHLCTFLYFEHPGLRHLCPTLYFLHPLLRHLFTSSYS